MIGWTILHYQIVETPGRGGMGVVYKARDTDLARFVAIKVLPKERVADPERKQRFVHEANAASALNHTHIVHTYDIAVADGIGWTAGWPSALRRRKASPSFRTTSSSKDGNLIS